MITPAERDTFPLFMNHKSARLWLKAKYGKYILMKGTEKSNEGKTYIYHLVLDEQAYMNFLETKHDQPESYQIVRVPEQGHIEVEFKETEDRRGII